MLLTRGQRLWEHQQAAMADGDFIDYLVAHGAYAEAARVAAERGELRRAIALYERV
jgi:hypothetical protein